MGRRGKKKSSASAPAAGSEQEGGSERTADTSLQAQPRKRGRPKKIVVEKALETLQTLEGEEEEEEEEEKKSKSPKELFGESSSVRAEKGKGGDDDEDVVYSKTKPKVVKREGTSRRKSEPRRAAE